VILLTIGTQLPFDRLVAALDNLAPQLTEPIFGQIGASSYRPKNFEAVASIAPGEFEHKFREARVVVAHAGIGTILSAQKHSKPLILFPRRASFGEHRNDHQLATCAQLGHKPGLYVAKEVEDLHALLVRPELGPADSGAEVAGRREFLDNLAAYLSDSAGR
jgi:UDP-N-acetylglucosamine transferase subunit ALG13